MRALLAAIVAGLVTEIRESLPSSEDECGMFVAGMAWAFAIFIVLLLLVTLGWALQHGVAL